MRTNTRREKGVATVEMAIVLPIFVLILIGMAEFGLILHDNLILENAAREGARLAAVGGSQTAVEQRVRDFAIQLNSKNLNVSVTNAQGERGSTVVIQTTYPVPLITPFMSALLSGNTFMLNARAQMRLE